MLTFKTEKVTDRVTRIFAFATELMYLVEGENKAALLDTGSGLGSLKTCMEQLTDKPVIVLVTHGHTDHAMGADEFDEIYMNHEDDYVYGPHGDMDFRRDGFDTLTEGLKYEESDIIPTAPLSKFRDLKEGDSFDLGGVHIDMYACPGHTKGSLVMLIREERSILPGDACNNFTFVYDAYSTTISEYEESLKRLKKLTDGKYDTVYLSHGNGKAEPDIISDIIDLCEDIKAGRTDDLPMHFRGDDALIAQSQKGICRLYLVIKGRDYTGAPCQVHVINRGSGAQWKPTVTTDSKALFSPNNADCDALLEGRKCGPLVRIYAHVKLPVQYPGPL